MGDHEPNTCPDIVSEDEEDDDDDLSEEELAKIVKQGVETVYYTLEGLHLWPETGATWLKGQLFMGENGIHQVANTLVRDDSGHLQLKNLSSKKKKLIVKSLVSDEKFGLHIKACLEKYAKKKKAEENLSDSQKAELEIANGVAALQNALE